MQELIKVEAKQDVTIPVQTKKRGTNPMKKLRYIRENYFLYFVNCPSNYINNRL